MLSNEDKNEIIEMLRCPTCGGIGHPLSEGQPVQLLHCQTCNGTGIRLPEKVEEKKNPYKDTAIFIRNDKNGNIIMEELKGKVINSQREKSCNFIRTGKGCHDCVNQIPAHLNDGNYCGIDMAQECPENMFSHYEEKSCGNCKFEPLAENSPCIFCDDFEEMWNWQPKEQGQSINLDEEDWKLLKL